MKFIYEEVISKILEEIPQGLNIYLYLDPYGEVDQLEVNCDGEWLAIGLSLHGGTKEEKNYYSQTSHLHKCLCTLKIQ